MQYLYFSQQCFAQDPSTLRMCKISPSSPAWPWDFLHQLQCTSLLSLGASSTAETACVFVESHMLLHLRWYKPSSICEWSHKDFVLTVNADFVRFMAVGLAKKRINVCSFFYVLLGRCALLNKLLLLSQLTTERIHLAPSEENHNVPWSLQSCTSVPP